MLRCFLYKNLSFNLGRYIIGLMGMGMAFPAKEYGWMGIGASGSMATIIIFYILVPFIKKFVNNDNIWKIFVVILLICSINRILMKYYLYGSEGKFWLAYFSPATNLWYVFLGVLLFWLQRNVKVYHIYLSVFGCIVAYIIYNAINNYAFFACLTASILLIYWYFTRKNVFAKIEIHGELVKFLDFTDKLSLSLWLVPPIILTLIEYRINIIIITIICIIMSIIFQGCIDRIILRIKKV